MPETAAAATTTPAIAGSSFGQADWQRYCLLRSLGIQASTGTESIESASLSIPPRQEFDLSRAAKWLNLIQARP